MDDSSDVHVVNVQDEGQSCGLDVIQTTSGLGPTTLALTVNKSVAIQVSASVEVKAAVISAGIGFSVTDQTSVTSSRTDNVPAGKFEQLDAMTLYQNYSFDIAGGKTGSGLVRKPVGVCFAAYDPAGK